MSLSEPSLRTKPTESTNYLDLTPYAILSHEINPNGLAVLHVPRFRGRIWKFFFRKSESLSPIKLNLDEFGSATWMLINGENKVHTIISSLESQFGEKIQPADKRITRFLSNLYRDKFIGFLEIR